MYEVVFLLAFGFVWIFFASISDLKKREVPNWLSFSLIIFALGFRFFYGLFEGDFGLFFQGVIGLGIFFVLGNALYYGRLFAGGDAKLMIALGSVLPLTTSFYSNVKIFAGFLFLFLFAGAVYGLVVTIRISLVNFDKFKKTFFELLKENKLKIFGIMFLGMILFFVGFVEGLFFPLGILIFVFPYLYFYARAVDKSCMIKEVSVGKLTEGDWLAQEIKIGAQVIKPNWEGLSKGEIKEIKKKKKKVLIQQGIPFVPVFLIAFLVFIYLWRSNLWNAFW